MIQAIAFDADDTLWHCESLFQDTQARLSDILDRYADHAEVSRRLHDTEARNIKLFGYGIKGFTLSMVETAIEISEARISADDIHRIVSMGRAMLEAPMQLLEEVPPTLTLLATRYPLYLVTKGDTMDQRNKIEKSGLGHHFTAVEVVLEKNPQTYREVFGRQGIDPARVLMVGNSVPSDILPVLELGGWAAHIPYHVTASFERHDSDPNHARFTRLERISEVPAFLDAIPAARRP